MNLQKPPYGIEWTRIWGRPGFTANPVRGCRHGCRWRMPDGKVVICYAKAVAEGLAQKQYPQGFEHVTFHPEELRKIEQHRQPAGIFFDSMSDLFGSGVEADWINQCLETVANCPWHVFFVLTKNASRLRQFSQFPQNLFLGVSAPPTFMFGKELNEKQRETWFRFSLERLNETNARVKWVSIEPLSIDLSETLARFALDWAVIGAGSDGRRTYQPDLRVLRRTLEALRTTPVFFKGNLDKALAGTAGGWREEFPRQEYYRPVDAFCLASEEAEA